MELEDIITIVAAIILVSQNNPEGAVESVKESRRESAVREAKKLWDTVLRLRQED
jgi:hypothetical protein